MHPQFSLAEVTLFWARVDVSLGPDACWLWQGTRNYSGYGLFRIAERQWRAHRVSWILTHGSISDDLCVLHDCDVRYPVRDRTYRRCVNPAHLWLGTRGQNASDCKAKGRARGPINPARGDDNIMHAHPERHVRGERWHQIYGSRAPDTYARGHRTGAYTHPESVMHGQGHYAARLTDEDVCAIRQRYAVGGITQTQLAAEYGVHPTNINQIVHRRTWTHLD